MQPKKTTKSLQFRSPPLFTPTEQEWVDNNGYRICKEILLESQAELESDTLAGKKIWSMERDLLFRAMDKLKKRFPNLGPHKLQAAAAGLLGKYGIIQELDEE